MEPTLKSSPKDVFFHLLSILTLYLSAVSFGTILFQHANYWFPDPLVDAYMGIAQYSQPMRWGLASLIIVFPVYLWLAWKLAREVTEQPGKRELKIRKWLLYFTLFLAAVVIIIDLIALIYNFLGGDLTTRFVLKIAAVLLIAAVVFRYYLWNLRSDVMASRVPRMRILVFGTIAAVAVAIVSGFFVTGSPSAERMRRFDLQRVWDLQSIQEQVVSYWQKKEALPANLEILRNEISGFIPPKDPETGASYEYRVLGNLKFELCAEFQTDAGKTIGSSSLPVPAGEVPETWVHGVGKACFERTIDPDLYKLGKVFLPS